MSTKAKTKKQEIIEQTAEVVDPIENLDVVFKPSNDLQLDRLNIRQLLHNLQNQVILGTFLLRKSLL